MDEVSPITRYLIASNDNENISQSTKYWVLLVHVNAVVFGGGDFGGEGYWIDRYVLCCPHKPDHANK